MRYKLCRLLFFFILVLSGYRGMAQMKVGDSAIAIVLPDTNGKWMDMAQYKDKLVLVDFWASWCVPCKSYFPILKEWYRKYNSMGLVIIAVSLDKNYYSWMQAIHQYQLPFVHVNDVYGFQGKNVLNYKVHSIPQKFLVYNGKIVSDGNYDVEQVEKKIKEVLNIKL